MAKNFTLSLADAFYLKKRCNCSREIAPERFIESIKRLTSDVIVIRGLPVLCSNFYEKISSVTSTRHIIMTILDDNRMSFKYVNTDYQATMILIKNEIKFISKKIEKLESHDIAVITLQRNDETFYIIESCHPFEKKFNMFTGIDEFINENNYIFIGRIFGLTKKVLNVRFPQVLRTEADKVCSLVHPVSSFRFYGYSNFVHDAPELDDNRVDFIFSDMNSEIAKSLKMEFEEEYRYEWYESECGELAHEIVTIEYESFF